MHIRLRQQPLYAVAESIAPDTSCFLAGNVVNGLLDLYIAVPVAQLMPGQQ
jgi:hypothetical protein